MTRATSPAIKPPSAIAPEEPEPLPVLVHVDLIGLAADLFQLFGRLVHGDPARCYNRRACRRVRKIVESRQQGEGGHQGHPQAAAWPWPPDPARVRSIIDGLEELYPDVDCELDRETPFQLVCATILSAQSTDERVNKVTPELFRRYPTPAAMATAPLPELEKIIRSTGFFRRRPRASRARRRAWSSGSAARFRRTLAELTTLPGVARKTANVVLGTAYGIAEGVVVDTHVQRLAMRLGADPQDRPEGDREGPDEGAPAASSWIRVLATS